MNTAARKAAELIKKHRNGSIEIVSHMDTDGVCSAALISKALDRLDIPHNVKFVRMLYRDVIEGLDPPDLTIFTDLGSSQLQNVRNKFLRHDVIIADHHEPQPVEGWPGLVHLNAHHYSLDGVQEVSGAGMVYLIARELDPSNLDLSALAIVGAIGDIQNAWGKLMGYNREIAKDAVRSGVLDQKIDLMLYGRHSRPIFKALESFTDPPIPGISNYAPGCVSLLKDLDIQLKGDGGWRRPVDLTDAEKQRLATELIARAYMYVPAELVKYVPGLIIGEAHTLLAEEERSILRDADGFSTCMNSTARHEQPLIGFEVAKGDRKIYLKAMFNLLRHHRRSIAEGMEFVEQTGLQQGPRGYIQYFDASGEIKETFIGTIASLNLGYGNCDPYRPIVGVIRDGGMAKISARCSKLLFLKGLDMARAIREAAHSVGGEGGGHAVACGAQVPENQVAEFLGKFEDSLIEQLG
ncbi:MAG: DHH family phosphoesterase [Hadesarchaea archaeon]|nr:DHH family phosphoesterase [Hadesarchaea archaeon]